MVSNNTINSINTYYVVTLSTTLDSTPTKVLNKKRKTRHMTHIATIKRAQSDTTVSDRSLSTSLHSLSQPIIRARTNNISLCNNSNTSWCADSGASKDLFHDYSTLKIYHCFSNSCATLGYTTGLSIEGICTVVYTLNGRTILTCNTIHIPALRGPLYYLREYRQRPGCGVYYSYKDG